MQKLFNSANEVVSIIGGATAYITVNPGISALVDGTTRVTLPIGYSDAVIKAKIGSTGNQVTVLRGDNDAVILKIEPNDTDLVSAQKLETLEMQCILKNDMPNTLYKAGDTLAFRWAFFVEKAVNFD